MANKSGDGKEPSKKILELLNKKNSLLDLNTAEWSDVESFLKINKIPNQEILDLKYQFRKSGNGSMSKGFNLFKDKYIKPEFITAKTYDPKSVNQDPSLAKSEITPEGYDNKHFMPYVKDYNYIPDKPVEPVVDETVEPVKKKTSGGGTGGQRTTPSGGAETRVNQVYDANGDETVEYMQMANDWKKNELMRGYQHAMNIEPEQIDEYYAPDHQLPDIGGTIGDVGRAAVGFMGTQEELPTYTPSAAMVESIEDARRQKEIGLSAEEENYRQQLSDRAYASDVANIRRMVGGSAGTALANLGSASKRYYDNMAQTAAIDEGVRRQAEGRFDERAGQAENIKRLQHGEARQLAMMNKEGAAGLMNDALTNMRERADFNKYYGKGSAHYEMQKENVLDSRQYRADRKNAAQALLNDARQGYGDDIARLGYEQDGAKIYSTEAENNKYMEEAMNNRNKQTMTGNEFANKMVDGYTGDGEVTVNNAIEIEDGRPVSGGKVVYKEKDVLSQLNDIPEGERGSFLESANPFNKEAKQYTDSDDYDQFNEEHNKKLEELYKKAEKWEKDMLDKIK